MKLREINLSENLLRHLWNQKYLITNKFISTTGEEINVKKFGELHNGFGPDFQNAEIKINGIRFYGNIEFHRDANDWHSHLHSTNKQFNTTILHVVLKGNENITIQSEGKRVIPTVILEKHLSENISNITEQLLRDEGKKVFNHIPCYTKNESVDKKLILNMLPRLAKERFDRKVSFMEEELYYWIDRFTKRNIKNSNQASEQNLPFNSLENTTTNKLIRCSVIWEDLLFSNLCDALGYSQHRSQMRKLSEIIYPSLFQNTDKDKLGITELQSLLFAVSGLKPTKIKDQPTKIFWHSLQQSLKSIRKLWNGETIPENSWIIFPTRPANHPSIRIAASSYLLIKIFKEKLFREVILILEISDSTDEQYYKYDLLLTVPYDSYWSNYWNFNSPSATSHSLIGKSRRLDIIVNIFLPIILLYSKLFSKPELAEKVWELMDNLPLMETNSVLRKMENQLIKQKFNLTSPLQQQALIDLNEQYCLKDKCSDCEVGRKIFNINK